MKTFELADDNGTMATIGILDDMSIDEAREILKYNGVNHGDSFSFTDRYYMYHGIYFYHFRGGYCMDFENVPHVVGTLSEMKLLINRLGN